MLSIFYRNNHIMQTSEPSIESGLQCVLPMNGVSTMYNIFSVIFTFPTVYRCSSATQVDACRPCFCSEIYWRAGTVAKLQCTLEFPAPAPLFSVLNAAIGVLPDNVEEV